MGEILGAVSSFLLVGVTGMLWWVTTILVRNTKEDFERRKIEATVAAWGGLRADVPVGGLPKLLPDHPDLRQSCLEKWNILRLA